MEIQIEGTVIDQFGEEFPETATVEENEILLLAMIRLLDIYATGLADPKDRSKIKFIPTKWTIIDEKEKN